MRYLQYAELVLITLVLSSNLFAADAPPACRFDAQSASLVETALTLASDAYAVLETPLPFDKIVVNPTTPAPDARTLTVYVVLDASEGQVNGEILLRINKEHRLTKYFQADKRLLMLIEGG